MNHSQNTPGSEETKSKFKKIDPQDHQAVEDLENLVGGH